MVEDRKVPQSVTFKNLWKKHTDVVGEEKRSKKVLDNIKENNK